MQTSLRRCVAHSQFFAILDVAHSLMDLTFLYVSFTGVSAIASCAGQCHCLPTPFSNPSPCPNGHQLTACNPLCPNSGLAMMIEVRCLSATAITSTNAILVW